jgi:hypothetical protein
MYFLTAGCFAVTTHLRVTGVSIQKLAAESTTWGTSDGTVQKLGVKAGPPTGRQPHERRNPYAPFMFRGIASPSTPNFWTVPTAVLQIARSATKRAPPQPFEGRTK